MYSALDITGLVLGILGLSGTVLLVRYLLPKHRIASLERAYATAYCLYQCSVSEGLLLPNEQTKLREKLRRTRTSLNEVKNRVTCLGGTWRKIFTTLRRIYRNFGEINSSIHSICVQVASSSETGKERLEKDGIPYDPCMFPLATTVSLESFKMGDHGDTISVHQLFPSQQDLPHIFSTNIPNDIESAPYSEIIRPKPAPSPRHAPQHRDSVSSTATTVVEEPSSCDDHSTITTGTSTKHCDTELEKNEVHASPSLGFLLAALQKGVDPSNAVSNCCTDLQWRVNLLQAVSNSLHASESQGSDYSADLNQCKEDLLAVVGRLSKVSDIWARRETGPMLPI
ncbi:hypothetical protein QCA50_004833 [Cerrena zonata]|uniref:Uncharacterized protein n=1 Tax=Cerrena zonata TaxID=2478898 RepID=A0AAW0GPA9_9APHY